jgi:hypothetical protein
MKRVDAKVLINVFQVSISVMNVMMKGHFVKYVKQIITQMIMVDAHIQKDVKFHIWENVSNVKMVLP